MSVCAYIIFNQSQVQYGQLPKVREREREREREIFVTLFGIQEDYDGMVNERRSFRSFAISTFVLVYLPTGPTSERFHEN